jgi:rsbT co-antagonist protein RsbR
MNSIVTVAQYLIHNAETLAIEIVDYNIEKLDFEVPKDIIKKAIIYQTEFIKYVGEAVTYHDDEQVKQGFIEWNKKHGQHEEAFLLTKVSGIVKPFPGIRLLFNKRFTAISIEHNLSTEEVVTINNRLNYILDISVVESILAYENYTDNNNKKRQREINELSAPIVPIQEGMAVLPLIGSIDTDRAEYLMSKVVPKISQLRIEYLIIDFSGIVTIDSDIASYVFNINNVLRLLGINVIVTGIRPDLATRVVSDGIDFSSIKAYANVKQALESIK